MADRKLTKHESREAALLLLYQKSLNDGETQELLDDNVEEFGLEYDKNSLKLVNGVLDNDQMLTDIIAKYSTSRSVDRIPLMNRSILKIAMYEIVFCPSVPDVVAINEAVELAKEYCYNNDKVFINGVLNSFYKDKLKEEKAAGNND